ncbi:MAG TPA: helix-turn-helix domain-containing protein [Thermoleophilaceae bacterium]|nr:helix-turn-helix domain-containing protein [Thermoleophilaceae bacterium]
MAASGDKPRGDYLELIADPLRLRVVRFLEQNERGSLSQLADAAGVHANTLRPHVLEMEDAGLLIAERRVLPSRRGRPGIDYKLSPGWRGAGTDFLGIAELLAAALGRVGLDADRLRDVGEEWGRYLVGRPGSYDVEEELPRVLGRLGFEASVSNGKLQLTRCPCSTVAPDQPEIMCMLAEGVIQGALAAAGSGRTASAFDHDAERRRCSAKLATPK